MRKLVLVVALLLAPAVASRPSSTARAEVALGAFFGEPTGLDLKLGLSRKTALDLLFGWYSRWNDRYGIDDGAYAHVTYLVQPLVTHGDAVIVPLRLGIGGAVFDDRGHYDGDIHIAARFPLQVALRWKRTPLEIYGEIALKLTVVDPGDDHRTLDFDGGLGIRFYF